MARRPKSILPPPSDIRARTSSITYAIAASAAPYAEPSDAELDELLHFLGMDKDHMRCAFCNEPTKRLGHLNSLVEERRPTGWGTTINNLIPVCGNCSSSRGNQLWRSWIHRKMSDPNWKGLPGAAERVQRLELLQKRYPGQKLDWSNLPKELVREFTELQAEADHLLAHLHEVGRKIKESYSPPVNDQK